MTRAAEGEPAQPRRFAGAGWGIADQALSSGTNFLLIIAVASATNASDFGVFSLAFSIYSFATAIQQSVVCDPMTFSLSRKNPYEQTLHGATALAYAACIGGAFSVPVLLWGTLATRELRSTLFVLSVALPALLLQDAYRFYSAMRGQPRSAFLNDLVWSVLQFVGFAVLLLIHGRNGSSTEYTFVWACSGVIASAAAALINRTAPRVRGLLAWVSSTKHLSWRYGLEQAAVTGSNQLLVLMVTVFAGLAATGALRAGQALFGPLNVVFSACRLVMLPRLVRTTPHRQRSYLRAAAAVLLGPVLIVAGVLVLMPAELGRQLYGDTWAGAHALLFWFIAQYAALAIAVPAVLGLRALGAAAASLRLRLYVASLTLVVGAAGAAIAGATGAAAAMAAVNAVNAALLWVVYSRTSVKEDSEVHTSTRAMSSD